MPVRPDKLNSAKLTRSNYLGIASTVAICCLALTFSIISLYYLNTLGENISAIYKHPYQVSNNAGKIRTSIVEMRVHMEHLFAYGEIDDTKQTREALDAIYAELELPLQVLSEEYLSSPSDLLELERELDALKAAQTKVLDYALTHTAQEVKPLLFREVYPHYEAAGDCVENILDNASQKVRDFEESSHTTIKIAGTGSILLSVLIIGFSILFLVRINRRNRELYYRENLFNLLAENVDDVFLIYDSTTQKVEYISTNSERVLGLDPEQLQASPNVLHHYMDGEDRQFFLGLAKNGPMESSLLKECKLRNPKTGEERWMRFRIFPIAVNGKTTRYISDITDLTETLTVQQTLKDALVNAQKANAAKRAFLSNMSHEIRTPMNAIIGMTTIAANSLDDRERLEDCLSKIGLSSQHLLTLINEVLDMSKIEDGKLPIVSEPFNFRQFMETVTAVAYPQAVDRGLRFDVAMTGITYEELEGDSLRLNQILLNLLSNAMKFTPPGGSVRLEIRQLSRLKDHVQLRFTVADTGIGMSPAFLEKLYTPFEQGNHTITQKYGGTGLGMSITQNLVTLMGGSIHVTSKEAEGTIFQVDLPFRLLEKDAACVQPAELLKLQVLVVDDDRDVCEHTTVLFDKMGIHADWVLSGAEAVAKVLAARESGGYDVCLIDWQMPQLSGMETVRQIREFVGPETLIIIISGYSWSDIEESARLVGANAFLAKPIFPSALYNTLLAATSRSPARDASSPAPSAPKKCDLTGRRLLLAEDNELNREIAEEFLRQTGAEVDSVVNGQEAVTRFSQAEPGFYDAILLDVQMPVMDGHAAARRIRGSGRADAAQIPIIAMTANAFSEDVSAAKLAGMNEHIAKPIDINKLYAVLSQYMK